MNRYIQPKTQWLAALSAIQLCAGLALAQPAAEDGAGSSNDVVAVVQDTQPGRSNATQEDLARLNPLIPAGKSRIGIFRELLAMNPGARQQLLASYSPAKRAGLEAKIKEYELLTPAQRELRLRVTELRYYLLPLMASSSTNRPAQIALLPPEIAPMIEVRLERWDSLSPEQQQELLENETAVKHLTEFASIPPRQQSQLLTNMPAAELEALRKGLDKWQELSEERREEITYHFQEFFELTLAEKQKTLGVLSETQRAYVSRTISDLDRLNPTNAVRIMRGLDKVARLTPPEFSAFLNNVERWNRLSPSERKAWRDLVTSASIQPPNPATVQPRRRIPPSPSQTGAVKRLNAE